MHFIGFLDGYSQVSFWDVDMSETVTLDCWDIDFFDMSTGFIVNYDGLVFQADPESVTFHNVNQF